MALVKAFRGWRYNPKKIERLQDCIVPPYDVISEADLAKMKELSPFNYSKIILSDGEGKHQKAADLFKNWQKNQVLIQDTKPCLYFYKQTFQLDRYELFCQEVPDDVRAGGTLSRTGILCRVGLEEYSAKVVLPHEKTFSGTKADRYQLMEAAQGNMEPVFLGYDSLRWSGAEFDNIILSQDPVYSYSDSSGVKHQLWAIDDPHVHSEVEKALSPLKFYILDGHHRYETALKFYQDHQKNGRPSHQYVLANICSFKQPGTVILPTHRMIRGIKGFQAKDALENLGGHFELKNVADLSELEKELKQTRAVAFGLMTEGSDQYILARMKASSSLIPDEKLDLEVLHDSVLDLVSGNQEFETAYVKSIPEFQKSLKDKKYQLGFLVRPSTCDEVMAVAQRFHVMPHKSTFFYPKIPSGLVVNIFE